MSAPVIHRSRGVRSGVVITSLAQGVEECVCNSLDAKATEVHVDLDAAGFGFKVTDNGFGIAAEALAELPAPGATSKLSSAPDAAGTLGYHGEALAALCSASTVSIESRAAGSFETFSKVACAGRTVKFGLALEQRCRQGTTIDVRDLFFNLPIRRKALLSAGLLKEVERCREVVLRLALLRPGVTFTLYDRGRKVSLLRLIKGRSVRQSMTELFSHPAADDLVQLPSIATCSVRVEGWAVLPPHGHTNAGRQYIYVNGRPVRAAPVSKMVDGLFQQLYKKNAQLAFEHSMDLASSRSAGNRHAQFVLAAQCSPGSYGLSSESDAAEVVFADWQPLLTAAKLAVLRAWRPVLTIAYLKQLDQLEAELRDDVGQFIPEGQPRAGQGAVAVAAPTGSVVGFQDGVAGQAEAGGSLLALFEQCGQWPAKGAELAAAAVPAAATAPAAGLRSWPSRKRRGQGRAAAGSGGYKHTLTSKLVSLAGAAVPRSSSPAPSSDELLTSLYAAQDNDGQVQKRQRATAAAQIDDPGVAEVHAAARDSLPGMERHSSGALGVQRILQQGQTGWQPKTTHSPSLGLLGLGQERQHHIDCYAFELPGYALEPRDLDGYTEGHFSSATADAQGPSEASPLSWQPLPTSQLAAIAAAAGLQQQAASQGDMTCSPFLQPSLTISEQRLLAAVASVESSRKNSTWGIRPSSAPPHPRRRSRAVHTNPNSTLQAVLRGAEAAAGQPGVRGVDTESGVSGRASPLRQARGALAESLEAGCDKPSSGERAGRLPWQHQRKPSAGGYVAAPQSISAQGQGSRSVLARGLHSGNAAACAMEQSGKPGKSSGGSSPESGLLRVRDLEARLPQQRVSSLYRSEQQEGGLPVPPQQQQQQVLAQSLLPDGLQPAVHPAVMSSWRPTREAAPAALCPVRADSPGCESVLTLGSLEQAVFAQLKADGLSREQLQSARALAQVDSKFVPVVCGSLVVVVDQHAADERVQLERLRGQLVDSGGRPRQQHSLVLNPPLPLSLTHAEVQLLEVYGDKLKAWGWEWQQMSGGRSGALDSSTSGGTGKHHVLKRVPVVLGTALTATDMKLYIHSLGDSCGASGLPAGVVRVLNSKACRSAIMFGDVLLPAQGQSLVDNLKTTNLYNSCAHGRPTTAPLVNIQLLRRALKLKGASSLQQAGTLPSMTSTAARLRSYLEPC